MWGIGRQKGCLIPVKYTYASDRGGAGIENFLSQGLGAG